MTLSIEKGRAVLYSDFVTILRDASMQYITKLSISTSQSQKHRSPLPPEYKVMYPVDAHVRTVKIPPVHKIVLRGVCHNL